MLFISQSTVTLLGKLDQVCSEKVEEYLEIDKSVLLNMKVGIVNIYKYTIIEVAQVCIMVV